MSAEALPNEKLAAWRRFAADLDATPGRDRTEAELRLIAAIAREALPALLAELADARTELGRVKALSEEERADWHEAAQELAALRTELTSLRAERDALLRVASFLRSAVKSGEPWTASAQALWDETFSTPPTTEESR